MIVLADQDNENIMYDIKSFNKEVEQEAMIIDNCLLKIEDMLKQREKSEQIAQGYLTRPVNEYIDRIAGAKEHLKKCLLDDEQFW